MGRSHYRARRRKRRGTGPGAEIVSRIIKKTDIPESVCGSVLHAELTGNGTIIIENHAGIREYERNRIVTCGGGIRMTIEGSGLELTALTAGGLEVRGCICRIDMSDE